jgi:hypothetical protein
MSINLFNLQTLSYTTKFTTALAQISKRLYKFQGGYKILTQHQNNFVQIRNLIPQAVHKRLV